MSFLKKFFYSNSQKNTSEGLASLAFSQNPIAMVLTNESGVIVQINQAFTNLTGYAEFDCIGERMSLLKSGKYNNTFYKSFYEKLQEKKTISTEIYNRCKDGTVLMIKEHINSLQIGISNYFVVTLEDITEQKKLVERNQYLATHDPLTGLANRTLFEDRFSHATLNAVRLRKKVAILMCDVNEFKGINDNFGHSFGDFVLQKIAKKLQTTIRSSDTIARYGGDEFILILEQIDSTEEVQTVVNNCKASFPLTIEKEEQLCEINMSIGYACFPENGTTLKQLMDHADRKMYEAKDLFYGIG